ncbi:MAG: DUF6134 family protein [Thiotrichales bacterium]
MKKRSFEETPQIRHLTVDLAGHAETKGSPSQPPSRARKYRTGRSQFKRAQHHPAQLVGWLFGNPANGPLAWTLILWFALAAPTVAGVPEELKFKVFLDSKEIGSHSVTIERNGSDTKVGVEANFVVRVLSIPVFRYYHTAAERWSGSCLATVETHTKTNGKETSVKSDRKAQGLMIYSAQGQKLAEGCVRSYAYWNPSLLQTDRLLNTQTGEYQPAITQFLGESDFNNGNAIINAKHYQINVAGKTIDLWYSEDDQWIGLDTTVKGGRNLAYRRKI